MDLGPCTSFLSWDSGNPGPQNCDMPQDPGNPGPQDFNMQRDPGNPGPQNFDSRKTLEAQVLKIWICGETLETQNPESQNCDVSRPSTLHHSIQNFMLSIVPGISTVDELGQSDSKNLNCKNTKTYRTHPVQYTYTLTLAPLGGGPKGPPPVVFRK